jgi:hypothetical protein
MTNDAAIGFWSYAHEDDKLDGGNILQLSRLIMEEYNLLSGEPLKLFVDQNDIVWGQQWRERIDSSLTETTFFIPIITPRYFRRPECRREMLEFAAKAKMLGVEELLLPILYIEVSDLSPDNPDEAMALVARTEYVDWHTNRLLDPSSREYRFAVNILAQRLLDIARIVSEIQLKNELNAELENFDVDGIADIVEQIQVLIPDWLDAVMSEKSLRAQALGLRSHCYEQMRKLRKRGASASALLSAQIRYAREILPLAERALKDSQIYVARSMELDPLVSALARLVADNPESMPLVEPVNEVIEEAMEEIRRLDSGEGGYGPNSVEYDFRKTSHLGRMFQQCNKLLEARMGCVHEGNDIVRRWEIELIDQGKREPEYASPAPEEPPPAAIHS